jgi:hypothetical protein
MNMLGVPKYTVNTKPRVAGRMESAWIGSADARVALRTEWGTTPLPCSAEGARRNAPKGQWLVNTSQAVSAKGC